MIRALDESAVISALQKVVREEHQVQQVLAAVRQRRAAATLGQNRRSMNGLGRPRLEIDSYSYHYWGQRLGYKCWKDKQFLREFERDNPACRVKSTGTKEIMVGYAGRGAGAPERNRRFSKTYG
jgi:hypothetical protein